jgi:hypothetical protein
MPRTTEISLPCPRPGCVPSYRRCVGPTGRATRTHNARKLAWLEHLKDQGIEPTPDMFIDGKLPEIPAKPFAVLADR